MMILMSEQLSTALCTQVFLAYAASAHRGGVLLQVQVPEVKGRVVENRFISGNSVYKYFIRHFNKYITNLP